MCRNFNLFQKWLYRKNEVYYKINKRIQQLSIIVHLLGSSYEPS